LGNSTEENHLLYLNTYEKTGEYNNKQHSYLLTSYDNDTMYISTDVGILYIKSQNGDEYKLLEK